MHKIIRQGLRRVAENNSASSSITLRRKNGFLGRKGKVLEEIVGDIFYDDDEHGDGFFAPYHEGTKKFYLSLSNNKRYLLSPKELAEIKPLFGGGMIKCVPIRTNDVIGIEVSYCRSYGNCHEIINYTKWYQISL